MHIILNFFTRISYNKTYEVRPSIPIFATMQNPRIVKKNFMDLRVRVMCNNSVDRAV